MKKLLTENYIFQIIKSNDFNFNYININRLLFNKINLLIDIN